jgi:hypothetical protein
MKPSDLFVSDGATATTEDPNTRTPQLGQALNHVREVLVVAALVGRDGDAVRIFLDGSSNHIFDRAIVPQVNDFGTLRLQNPAHDVDGGIVPVEKTGGGHKSHRCAVQGVQTRRRGR